MNGKPKSALAIACSIFASITAIISTPATAARYTGVTPLPSPAAERLAQCTASAEIYKAYWTQRRRDNPDMGRSYTELLKVWRSMTLDYPMDRPKNGVVFGDMLARIGYLTEIYEKKNLSELPSVGSCGRYFQNDPRLAPFMGR